MCCTSLCNKCSVHVDLAWCERRVVYSNLYSKIHDLSIKLQLRSFCIEKPWLLGSQEYWLAVAISSTSKPSENFGLWRNQRAKSKLGFPNSPLVVRYQSHSPISPAGSKPRTKEQATLHSIWSQELEEAKESMNDLWKLRWPLFLLLDIVTTLVVQEQGVIMKLIDWPGYLINETLVKIHGSSLVFHGPTMVRKPTVAGLDCTPRCPAKRLCKSWQHAAATGSHPMPSQSSDHRWATRGLIKIRLLDTINEWHQLQSTASFWSPFESWRTPSNCLVTKERPPRESDGLLPRIVCGD